MDIVAFIESLELPQFRKKQIIHGIFEEAHERFEDISTLPANLRKDLDTKFPLRTLKLVRKLISQNNDTIKWSFLTSQNKPIEMVLMLHDNGRKTLCISSQSGCPVNCSFCWTGAMGFQQNLSTWEILEQILIANHWLLHEGASYIKKHTDDRPRVNRIVFMGMGEPMINFAAVTESIKIITDPDFLHMSQRSLTVSTSGYVPMMKKFWSQYPKVGVAISLHAPNQELRASIMPVAKQFDLDQLMSTCKDIQAISKRRITYEYILIDAVTDTDQCAYQLIELLKGQLAHVNLIPYNPIEGRDFQRPSRNRVNKFAQILNQNGISATARVTMGDDIKAACGQLSKHAG